MGDDAPYRATVRHKQERGVPVIAGDGRQQALHALLKLAARLAAGRSDVQRICAIRDPTLRVPLDNLLARQTLPRAVVELVQVSRLLQRAEVLFQDDLGGDARPRERAGVTEGELLVAQALPQRRRLKASFAA